METVDFILTCCDSQLVIINPLCMRSLGISDILCGNGALFVAVLYSLHASGNCHKCTALYDLHRK